ncbi:MAG: universal stress protein [Sandaracinaceae bacterium]
MTEASQPYRVVVGVDFDETGDVALAEAFRMAREHPNDEMHLVHSVPGTGKKHPSASDLEALSARLDKALASLRDRVHEVCAQEFPDEEFEQDTAFHVMPGDPVEVIHQVAVDYDADVIVVGTHGRTGVSKLIQGSVAEKLARTARLPVMVAHRKDFKGLTRSERPDAPRPEGLDGAYQRETLRIGRRGGHISGLL